MTEDGQVYVGAHAVPGMVHVTLRVNDACISLEPAAAMEAARMLATWAGWAEAATTHMQESPAMAELICGDYEGTA